MAQPPVPHKAQWLQDGSLIGCTIVPRLGLQQMKMIERPAAMHRGERRDDISIHQTRQYSDERLYNASFADDDSKRWVCDDYMPTVEPQRRKMNHAQRAMRTCAGVTRCALLYPNYFLRSEYAASDCGREGTSCTMAPPPPEGRTRYP
jgi:hypothetical protein